MEKKKIAVIGLGPTGGIFAAHLASSGHSVYGVDIWQEHIDEISKNQLKVTNLATLETPLQQTCTHPSHLPEKNFDYIVIAVKTPNMPGVVSALERLPGQFKVVVLQNGLDNEEYLADFYPRDRILRMAVNYAGNIASPSMIRMNFFAKPNHIGCICNTPGCTHAEEIAGMLSDAGMQTQAVSDVRKFTMKKVILNAILAPVSALLGVTMADVMADKGTRKIVESLIHESIDVAKAMGYDYGEDFFHRCVEFLEKAGAHKPSMLIDLERGNPTEIDYINGKLVFFGEKLNIPVPVNTTITELVRARSKSNLPCN